MRSQNTNVNGASGWSPTITFLFDHSFLWTCKPQDPHVNHSLFHPVSELRRTRTCTAHRTRSCSRRPRATPMWCNSCSSEVPTLPHAGTTRKWRRLRLFGSYAKSSSRTRIAAVMPSGLTHMWPGLVLTTPRSPPFGPSHGQHGRCDGLDVRMPVVVLGPSRGHPHTHPRPPVPGRCGRGLYFIPIL